MILAYPTGQQWFKWTHAALVMIEAFILLTAYLLATLLIFGICVFALIIAHDAMRTVAKRLKERQH